tara:strand:- start:4684 stop:5919 length:1236 start_codon:yes stop_codon:yes gene_type:complete
MANTAYPNTDLATRPSLTISADKLGRWMLAFGVFTSGFVMREPAPYELVMAGLLGVWFLCGLKISRTVAPVLVFFVLYNIGGLGSMLTMHAYKGIPLYLAVSFFLALTSVFFAALIEADYTKLKIIFQAYVIAAVVTSLLGIGGYLGVIPGGAIFTRYGRAMGAFQDPNVFGPYLVLPAMYLLHGLIVGKIKDLPFRAIGLLIITLGVFLSFSRAAWGLFAISGILLVALLLIRHRTGGFQLKIFLMSLAGLVLLVGAIGVALQIDQIAELFSSRAQLVQDYDGARFGRFARHAIGFGMALENPLGIGPLEFGLLLGEDTHNMYLKSLMAYGWLGFCSYLILMSMTFYFGFKYMLRERPWQTYFMLAMIVLLGHALVGIVIDTDHWRHFYLLIGLVWGCIALEKRYGMRFN